MPFDPTPITREPDDILRRLIKADRLLSNKNKWRQHGFTSAAGQRCILAAVFNLDHVRSPESVGTALNEAIEGFLETLLPDGFKDVARWQDRTDRTFPEVKVLLARAIEKRMAEVMEKANV